jgi:hypothetical protein
MDATQRSPTQACGEVTFVSPSPVAQAIEPDLVALRLSEPFPLLDARQELFERRRGVANRAPEQRELVIPVTHLGSHMRDDPGPVSMPRSMTWIVQPI